MKLTYTKNKIVPDQEIPDTVKNPVYVTADNLDTSSKFIIREGKKYKNRFANWVGSSLTKASDFLEHTVPKESVCGEKIDEAFEFVNNKFMQWIGNVKDTVNDLLGKGSGYPMLEHWLCNKAATAFEAIIVIIKTIIYFPMLLAKLLKELIKKVFALVNSVISKIFGCLDSAIDAIIKNLSGITISQLFKKLAELLIACDYVSQPILSLLSVTCEKLLPPLRDTIPMIDELLKKHDNGENHNGEWFDFRSSKEALIFVTQLNEAFNNSRDSLINNENVVSLRNSYKNFKKDVYDALKLALDTILFPLFWLERKYNSFLNTRSRMLGQVVNFFTGWIFPKESVTGERIKRRRYSIVDLLKIAEGMTKCSSYACKNSADRNRRRLERIYDTLCVGKDGKWFNPFQWMKESRSFMMATLDPNFQEDSVSDVDYLINSISNTSIDNLIQVDNISKAIDSEAKKNKNDSKVLNETKLDSLQSNNKNSNTNMSNTLRYNQIHTDKNAISNSFIADRFRTKELVNSLIRNNEELKKIDDVEDLISDYITVNNSYSNIKSIYSKIMLGDKLYIEEKRFAVERCIDRIRSLQNSFNNSQNLISSFGDQSKLAYNRVIIRKYKSLDKAKNALDTAIKSSASISTQLQLEKNKLPKLKAEYQKYVSTINM